MPVFDQSTSISHPASSIQPTPMPNITLLAYYFALSLMAYIIRGVIPVWFRLTHRGMQFAVSFVAGVMLGVAVLHMLPHAIIEVVGLVVTDSALPGDVRGDMAMMRAIGRSMIAVLAGVLAMFFIER